MGVSLKESSNFLQVPGPSHFATAETAKGDDLNRPQSRVPSNIGRLLKTPEIRPITRSATPKAQSWTGANTRPNVTSVATNRTRQKRRDEESLRTKIFWEQYAKDVQSEILKDTEEEKPKSHLIYSGRCGPKLKFPRSNSCESIETNLSLFSTSSLGYSKPVKEKRRKKKKEVPQIVKPDWVRLAKERRGALDRLIAKDASDMHGRTQVSSSNIIMQRAQVSELMSEEEKALLHDCGFRQGLAGQVKSTSTANILSTFTKADQAKSKRCRAKGGKDSSGTPSVASSRIPSPKVIGREVREQKRSESAIAVFNDPQPMSDHRLSVCKGVKPDFWPNGSTPASSIHALRDFQESNLFTFQVKRRIGMTLTNLDNMTGFGDPTDAQTTMSDEQIYTRADFAVKPRYPQHVRIAPQLSKIIIQDVRKRMGRPRYHELRKVDIERLNNSIQTSERASRNLMIFNWLNSLDEDYADKTIPGIYDLEGKPPNDRYPVIYEEYIRGDFSSDDDDDDGETECDTETVGASSVAAPSN